MNESAKNNNAFQDCEQVITEANRLWNSYQFEKACESILTYLRKISSPPKPQNTGHEHDAPCIIIACGGSGTRWGNFLGRPKHLVDIGDGIPLVKRTEIQLSIKFGSEDIHILIGEEHEKHFQALEKVNFTQRILPADENVGIEVLKSQEKRRSKDQGLLWLYGDIYFSEQAIEIMYSTIKDAESIKVFGRKHGNPNHQSRYGELFGVFCPSDSISVLQQWYELTKDLFVGSPMLRFSTWEVLSLISFLHSRGVKSPSIVRHLDISPLELSRQTALTFRDREFDKEIWVEIDDETDDFDYPYDYFQRLLWTAERDGSK